MRWFTHVAALCSPAYELKGTWAGSLSKCVCVCVCDFMYGLLAVSWWFCCSKMTPHKFTLATVTPFYLCSVFLFWDQNIEI